MKKFTHQYRPKFNIFVMHYANSVYCGLHTLPTDYFIVDNLVPLLLYHRCWYLSTCLLISAAYC